jgi:hypothetical protein
VRFEVLAAVKASMLFLCVVTPSEDGDSVFLRNIGIYPRVHAASLPRTAYT